MEAVLFVLMHEGGEKSGGVETRIPQQRHKHPKLLETQKMTHQVHSHMTTSLNRARAFFNRPGSHAPSEVRCCLRKVLFSSLEVVWVASPHSALNSIHSAALWAPTSYNRGFVEHTSINSLLVHHHGYHYQDIQKPIQPRGMWL